MIYVFKAPLSYDDTINALRETISVIGGVIDDELVAKWKRTRLVSAAKVQFYIHSASEIETDVRAVFKNHSSDERFFWDIFLNKLLTLYPATDFGVSTQKPLRIMAVLNLYGDTKTVYSSRTTGGTSLAGFLLGGFVFGAPGAIVGGLSGKQRTRSVGSKEFSNFVSVRMVMSNGRLEECTLSKKDKRYHEAVMLMGRGI